MSQKTGLGEVMGTKETLFKQDVKPQITFLLSVELRLFLTVSELCSSSLHTRLDFRKTKVKERLWQQPGRDYR